ncbi:MAG: endo-1,4-beta-xylanase [Marinilabiliaceae bacterium]
MNYKRHILPALALMAISSACDDETMEWKAKGGVSINEIPLEVKEVLANYDDIKVYAQQYMPGNIIGIGMGVDLYNANANGEKDLVDANYQMFTCGNAMKMDALMTNSGSLNFTTLDNLFDNMPADMKLYGHNFFWHTQQRQAYLKSVIAPEMVVETDGGGVANLLTGDASDFNGGTTGGWGSWGSNKDDDNTGVKDGEGKDGSACIVLTSKADGNAWEAQFAYTFEAPIDSSKTMVIKFDAKSSVSGGQLQFQYQNGTTYGSQGGYNTFNLTTDWATYQYEFQCKFDDANRIIINFGAVGGSYYVDNIEFGEKLEQSDPMVNILSDDASDFNGGTSGGWGSWGSNKDGDNSGVKEGVGVDGTACMVLASAADGNMWEAQCAYTFEDYLDSESAYIIQFKAKSSAASGQVQFQYQNGTTYGSQGGYETFNLTTDWVIYEKEFTPAYDDVNRIIINFGAVGATYYIDDVKFGKKVDSGNKATTITYVPKTAEQKKEALVKVMESWVSGVAEHLDEKGVVPYGYDVINEPIADGSNGVRGLDGVFGGSETDDDGNVTYDAEPEETTESGLNLNWGNNHWYWGYYVPDYAVRAFQLARKYLPAETKLFVNDYNLETSPAKLAALIEFINKIDADNGSPIVDGIGTQMHVTLSGTSDNAENNAAKIAACKEQVDAMFKTMAATGKLVRVTELDISLGASSPSSAQYQAQADCYEMIVKSYKENVPEAQQSGITIWSLSDNEAEHEYWLKGELPNLFDANYLRKWAYKGFCDGIAGEDLGLQFGGDLYKTYYERNNVSSTVK